MMAVILSSILAFKTALGNGPLTAAVAVTDGPGLAFIAAVAVTDELGAPAANSVVVADPTIFDGVAAAMPTAADATEPFTATADAVGAAELIIVVAAADTLIAGAATAGILLQMTLTTLDKTLLTS
jgi:hypothetical protein